MTNEPDLFLKVKLIQIVFVIYKKIKKIDFFNANEGFGGVIVQPYGAKRST